MTAFFAFSTANEKKSDPIVQISASDWATVFVAFFGQRYKSILTIPLLKSDPELRRTWREWREWRTFLMMIVSLSFSCQGSNRFASFTWESLTHKTKKWETISIEKLLEPNQVFLCLTLTDSGASTTCPLTNSPIHWHIYNFSIRKKDLRASHNKLN